MKKSYCKLIKKQFPGLPWWYSGWDCLLMLGTWVRAPVHEDPTRCRAAKPVCCNYELTRLEPVLCDKKSRCNEKAVHHNQEWPRLQLESACAQPQRPSASNTFFFFESNFQNLKAHKK